MTELSIDVMDPALWQSGEIHKTFVPGQLARIECEVQLLDGGFFASRVERFSALAEAIADIKEPPKLPGNATARAKAQAKEAARASAMGIAPTKLDAITRMVQSLIGDSVLMRVLPCGADEREYGFTGALLNRREYIQEERENLFSRYGQAPTVWTAVFQIAAIPEKPRRTAELRHRELSRRRQN